MSDETPRTDPDEQAGAVRATSAGDDAQPTEVHAAAPAAPDEPLPPEPVTAVPLEPVEPQVPAEPIPVIPEPNPVVSESESSGEPSAPAQAAATVKAKAEEAAGSVGATAAGVASTVQAKAEGVASTVSATADQATTTVTSTADEKPEIPIGVAFAGGFIVAKILKAIGS